MALELDYKAEVFVRTDDMDEQTWLDYRRKGIGGSDAAAVIGISPYKTARDVYFEKMLETYRKRPTKFRAKKIAAMLHKTKHAAVVDRLTHKLQDATKEYKRRFPGEALEKGYREVLARVERRQEELKKQGIRADILREEPFTIARDSLDYKLYLMIWKERRGNRITEIEEYIC